MSMASSAIDLCGIEMLDEGENAWVRPPLEPRPRGADPGVSATTLPTILGGDRSPNQLGVLERPEQAAGVREIRRGNPRLIHLRLGQLADREQESSLGESDVEPFVSVVERPDRLQRRLNACTRSANAD